MILHVGERVFWGAPEVIYLEGTIKAVNEDEQTVIVHIERATPHSAHLIDSELPFAANGVKPLKGDSPPGTTAQRSLETPPPLIMSDDEKVLRGAAVAVHERYGYNLPEVQERGLIRQVAQIINDDPAMRQQIITSMDEILKRQQ
ncbi:hypothetical protein EI42_04259 [Thermosporothrix hazakensis]|jgi:hypothetical protein|uniref:Uncharacterized protein n=2 Tax=Thermosporothrix TaxID=768650 RepID=A0A326UF70_THEHA|nr:hypothetical protein [Thermosporothrix hazakensis]PZW25415.1 hypothetical protein EI42_04259 [Thermosporothrix hazakensis]BBH90750.1 hypothetical protein KTC_55010 [Thermosporothrix sp. COM3]GCE48800.1 hypothetical protein KTH_36690 [Thermosporothrix hazakensis]